MWHYHATLPCGHKIAFDSPRNYFLETLHTKPEALVAVTAECAICHQDGQSTALSVNSGTREQCAQCMKQVPQPKEEVHHVNHDR